MDEDWRSIQSGGEESWTQAIGRGCYVGGFEGLIVPSARNPSSGNDGGKNIVIFPENLSNGSKIEILAADQLP
ncbi:hypothetical protein RMSM_02813 [Rhodopirellula maiorica SM1]|uniref:RES domain-containing protein n=1 Tax=Rhodopirellula maiorica SM1 TaxID=1265738 RepID=M5RM38_9BACT|nr:hypothetical protein RMSM_02813 [Rhodopirellula maiorica SM1]